MVHSSTMTENWQHLTMRKGESRLEWCSRVQAQIEEWTQTEKLKGASQNNLVLALPLGMLLLLWAITFSLSLAEAERSLADEKKRYGFLSIYGLLVVYDDVESPGIRVLEQASDLKKRTKRLLE